MDEWLLRVISTAGYAGIASLMFIENAIPVIPSELIVPFACDLATQRQRAAERIAATRTSRKPRRGMKKAARVSPAA